MYVRSRRLIFFHIITLNAIYVDMRIEQLSSAQSKRVTLTQIVSRPSSAVRRDVRPVPPQEPRPSSLRPAPPLERPERTDPDLEQVRLQLKGRLEEAFQSGTLEEAVQKALGEGERTLSPSRFQEPPELFVADEAFEKPPDELMALKLQMRQALTQASEKPGGSMLHLNSIHFVFMGLLVLGVEYGELRSTRLAEALASMRPTTPTFDASQAGRCGIASENASNCRRDSKSWTISSTSRWSSNEVWQAILKL